MLLYTSTDQSHTIFQQIADDASSMQFSRVASREQVFCQKAGTDEDNFETSSLRTWYTAQETGAETQDAPEFAKEIRGSQGDGQTNTDNHHTQFTDDFPHGYTPMHTESTGLQCGLFALLHSMRHQGRYLRVLTPDELRTIATSGTVHLRIQELGGALDGEEFDQNYLVDHLDAVLQEYGRLQGRTYNLGYMRKMDSLGFCWVMKHVLMCTPSGSIMTTRKTMMRVF
jgi:hypothetical protein